MSPTTVRGKGGLPRYVVGLAVCLASAGLIGGVMYWVRGPDADHRAAIERMREHARNGYRFGSPAEVRKAFEGCYRFKTPEKWYTDLLATAHRRIEFTTRDGVACVRYQWNCDDGLDGTTVDVDVHSPSGRIWGVSILEWAS
jgi:hypothetical protein